MSTLLASGNVGLCLVHGARSLLLSPLQFSCSNLHFVCLRQGEHGGLHGF
jgi:hypothetical protein